MSPFKHFDTSDWIMTLDLFLFGWYSLFNFVSIAEDCIRVGVFMAAHDTVRCKPCAGIAKGSVFSTLASVIGKGRKSMHEKGYHHTIFIRK